MEVITNGTLLVARHLRVAVCCSGRDAAHTADLVDELAQSRFVGALELERLLMAVAEKVTAPTVHRYDCDEDERLVTAVMTMLGRGLLGEAQLRAFVDRFFQPAWGDSWA